MKRPMVWCTALFACGAVVRQNFSLGIVITFICCIMFTAASYKRLCYLLLIPVFFLGMLPSYIYEQKYLIPLEKFEGRETELIFRIADCSSTKSSGGYNTYTIKTFSADGEPLSATGVLYCHQKFNENDIVAAECSVFPVSSIKSSGSFDYKSYQINKGYAFSSYANYGEVTGVHSGGIIDKISSFRKAVIFKLKPARRFLDFCPQF